MDNLYNVTIFSQINFISRNILPFSMKSLRRLYTNIKLKELYIEYILRLFSPCQTVMIVNYRVTEHENIVTVLKLLLIVCTSKIDKYRHIRINPQLVCYKTVMGSLFMPFIQAVCLCVFGIFHQLV